MLVACRTKVMGHRNGGCLPQFLASVWHAHAGFWCERPSGEYPPLVWLSFECIMNELVTPVSLCSASFLRSCTEAWYYKIHAAEETVAVFQDSLGFLPTSSRWFKKLGHFGAGVWIFLTLEGFMLRTFCNKKRRVDSLIMRHYPHKMATCLNVHAVCVSNVFIR